MTREEAIERLRNESCKSRLYCELYPDACMKEECEIYMAIEALEERPWREYIGKHEAYMIMCDVLDALWGKEAIKKTVYERLKQAPSTDKWIPCSERLPEELSVVNVTYVNHDPEPYYDFVKDIAFTETAVYYRGDWYWNWSGCVDVLAEYGRDDANKVDKAVEVIAWMPLPAPWKEGESNG